MTPGREAFFEGAAQREALARLRFAADGRRRRALLLGGPGVGKSWLLSAVGRERDDLGDRVASLDLFGLTPREFYFRLASELGAEPWAGDDATTLQRRLADRVVADRALGVGVTLLVDSADQAGADTLSHLQRVLRSEQLGHGRVGVVIAADPARLVRLGDLVEQVIDLRVDLEPWDEGDTIEFLQVGLVEAGADGPLFDYEAIAEIHRLSGGVPRRVTRLADHALLIGACEGAELVDVELVRAAEEAAGPAVIGSAD